MAGVEGEKGIAVVLLRSNQGLYTCGFCKGFGFDFVCSGEQVQHSEWQRV